MAQSRSNEFPNDQHDQKIMVLSRLLKALRSTTTPEEAITLALNHVHQELDFEVAWVGRYDRINHRLLTKGCHSPTQMRSMRTVVNLTPGDVLEQVVIQLRPLIVADLQNEIRAGEWGTIAKQLKLQSAIIFPIKHQESCLGLLVLASPDWGKSASLGERSYLAIVMGELAETLSHFEADQQRQQAKRLEQPLLALIGSLGNLPDIDSQLSDVLREIQRFIAPHRTRVFWLEPKGNYFWQRMPTLSLRPADQETDYNIAVDEVRSLYQALCNEQLVVIGESQGALKAIVSERMMQHIHAQALLVAPISHQGDLVGFISVEGNQPRIWQEAEKQFVIGAARLLSLALPGAMTRESGHQVELDQHLTTGVIQGIHGDVDWQQTLQTCFTVLQDRLAIQQFFVLLFNPDRNGYDLCFQSQASRPRGVPLLWPCLDNVDWQMLERSPSAVSIDSLAHDLKLMAWRSILRDLSAQSLLVSNVAPGNAPEGLVIICDRVSRQWTTAEQSLFEAVARQIGVILHQWQLQRQLDQQQHIYEAIQWGLQALYKELNPTQLEQVTLQQVMQLLKSSTVLLVTWPAGGATATVTQMVSQDSSVRVKANHPISVGTDALINWAVQADGLLPLTVDELPPATTGWLNAPAGSRLLTTALRTAPTHAVTGLAVAVLPPNRHWTNHHLTIFKLLINQLAWSRRHLAMTTMLTQQRQDLENLNWYKHHRLEDLYRILGKLAQDLGQLKGRERSSVSELEVLQDQLSTVMENAETVLIGERWQLHTQQQSMPLVSMLNRLLERINPILEARQLWSKFHNESNVVLGGDMLKLELILYEVMAAACNRSPVGGRIDLWCRVLNLDWVELSVTDDGVFSPQLLDELNQGYPADVLAPSPLDEPPGLQLSICKLLLDQLGGEMSFSILEDGRTHSRLLLPLAPYGEVIAGKPRSLPTPMPTPETDPSSPE
ncbi:GAF domain-containing protein [Nodosilinea sp. LEGE 07088]|uniref:sensor histidine kinase n=1 Tax=Nodosilinea sp. LEGE 07088 TaxID=2777968 RepID=UPI001880AA18|nr:GAF domain-containing protein [Nodosilinea sp. LEGE 07088]MBE9138392.1 GAF domain-containing protein [Nodosilinea sp. LEGE 07088]